MIVWSVALFATVWADYDDFQLARFDLGNMRAFLDRIQVSPDWRRVFERDGVFVFERLAPS